MKTGMSILLIFILNLASAQTAVETIIKTQAMQMGQALAKGDSKTFGRYLPKEMLKDPKDGQQILKLIDSGFNMFKAFGGEVKKITYGHPVAIVKNGKKWQSGLLQTTTIVSPFADAELESVLLAQSEDGGKNWTFIDLMFRNIGEIKDRMPAQLPKLALPKAAPPKITMKETRQ